MLERMYQVYRCKSGRPILYIKVHLEMPLPRKCHLNQLVVVMKLVLTGFRSFRHLNKFSFVIKFVFYIEFRLGRIWNFYTLEFAISENEAPRISPYLILFLRNIFDFELIRIDCRRNIKWFSINQITMVSFKLLS